MKFVFPLLFLLSSVSFALTTEEWLERIDGNTENTAYNTSRTTTKLGTIETDLLQQTTLEARHFPIVDRALTNTAPFQSSVSAQREEATEAAADYESMTNGWEWVGEVARPEIPDLNEEDVEKPNLQLPDLDETFSSDFLVVSASDAQEISSLLGIQSFGAFSLDFATLGGQDMISRVRPVVHQAWLLLESLASISIVLYWWFHVRRFVFNVMTQNQPMDDSSYRGVI